MKDQSIIYGIRAVTEAIKAERQIDKVYLQKGLQGPLLTELRTTIRRNKIPVSEVPAARLARFTKNNHQGAVATVSPIRFHDLEELVENAFAASSVPMFLMLDGVSDVRNFGAIIRTAECTGVQGIIIPTQGAAPVTADTIKTSAGAAFRVPIAKTGHLKDAIYLLQASGVQVVAATEKTSQLIYEVDLNCPCALILGSEDKGITPSILKIADKTARLPMLGEIGSLNVSVACGALLYEAVRQRGRK